MSAVDAIQLRSFQDKLILGMAVVSQIVSKRRGFSLFRQRMALSDFLSEGKQSFPSRYIDIICKCAAVLEHKASLGQLTYEEKGFATLFGTDEEICELYDFVISDASWTRLFGNLFAHPRLDTFEELNDTVSRSVHNEELPVATHCVAAYMCLYPNEGANERAESARVARDKKKVKGLRSSAATKKRHNYIIKCLAYYRDVKGAASPASKAPMF